MAGFVTGIIAKRNKWLDKPLPAELVNSCRIYTFVTLGVITTTMFVIATPLAYAGAIPVGVAMIGFTIPGGPLCPSLVVLVVNFFQTEMNWENRVSKLMADGAFVVYLLHYYFLNIYSFAFLNMLPASYDKVG